MKFVVFNAKCPFEIGDKVILEKKGVMTITDISCIHFLRSGEIEFRYELDNSKKYILLEVNKKGNN